MSRTKESENLLSMGTSSSEESENSDKQRKRNKNEEKRVIDLAACVGTCCTYLVRGVGYAFSTIALALIVLVVVAYFQVFLPILVHKHPFWRCYLISVFGLVLLYNILFNYIAARVYGPGHPPKSQRLWKQSLLMQISNDPETDHRGEVRWCKLCSSYKAMRTHHCSVCGRCVLKMDHHCPWLNSCVGFRNYRFFFMFLFWLHIGTVYMLLLDVPTTIVNLSGHAQGVLSMMATVSCLAAAMATVIYLTWYSYLISTNQTMIEYYDNRGHPERKRHSPYDVSILDNWKEVFGYEGHWLWRVLGVSIRNPPGNGLVFQLNAKFRTIKPSREDV